MFRKYPYWGWLLLCLGLWAANLYYYKMQSSATQPAQMAATVAADLHNREAVLKNLLADTDRMRRMLSDSLTVDEVKEMEQLPFYIYAYKGNYLRYWNTNVIIPEGNITPGNLLRTDRGVFVIKRIQNDDKTRFTIFYPVMSRYPVENDYLQSRFAASDRIPINTRIITPEEPATGAYRIAMTDGQTAFYLLFNLQDIQKWTPGPIFIALLLAAILATISWIHLIVLYLTRNRSPLLGFIAMLLVIILVELYLYRSDIPFNLDTLLFFSPQLYASSAALSSFGDLFINTLLLLWLVVFITRHTPYKTFFSHITHPQLRRAIPIILITAMLLWVKLFTGIVKSLVLDSSISFDVSRFYSIDTYSILGLLEICTITGLSCMIVYIINYQLRQLMPNNYKKYGTLLFCGLVLMYIFGYQSDPFFWALLGWLVLFILLLDIPKLTLVSDLFEPQMLFWALYIGIFCTGLLQYFNNIKEKEARKAFVEQRLAPHRDNVLEYTFDKTAINIEQDETIRSFFYNSSGNTRRLVDKLFDTLYLKGAAARYEATVYLFDADGRPLFNKDSGDYYRLVFEKSEAIPTSSPYLFYKESMPDKSAYLSYIPVYADTINTKIGYVIIGLSLKKQAAETVYPELLLPVTSKANPREDEYSYAVYVNGTLASQTNEYPFSTFLELDTLRDQDFKFYNTNNTSELHYKISDKRTIVVVHDRSLLLEVITTFSYIFTIQVGLAVLILLYQLYLSYFTRPHGIRRRFVVLTLRKRMQYAMLSIVFVSFVLIGIVTIWFFTSRYRANNSAKLRSAMQVARKSVQDYLNTAHAYETDFRFDSVTQSTAFNTFLTSLASNQKIDINLFDNNGNLFAASQDEIYQRSLLSRIMRQDAYYQLSFTGKSILIQNEQIAGLQYLSAYEPLRDERGVALGYLNVPFFSSERDLKYEISNIVITLINVYAFIFLISSLITVSITGWVTSSFNLIIRQLDKLNLQKNERISWPHNDEIGLVVEAYNQMVHKVEENAAKLAQSERESAWREMARQVAHEIKNPLTPMKLNIQYLQQAIKNDNPNIKELTRRVSESVIEQIDNLTYIASEFSNFAKMPEARPEVLNMAEMLQLATGLYRNEQDLTLNLSLPNHDVLVYSDHSQMLRMLTNLLENAKQAIPAERLGLITVSLTTHSGEATISIADNGTGISEETAQRLFQPYFTTKTSGTGLGLAMTKKIIEFWKGRIWFTSTEDVGTTFFISLPIYASSPYNNENAGETTPKTM